MQPQSLFRTYVTYDALRHDPVTRESLVAIVRGIPWQAAAKIAAGVPCISWQHGVEDRDEQRKFVDAFTRELIYDHTLIRLLENDEKSVIFTRENLLAVFRVALVEMSDGDRNCNISDAFTRACLMVNTLVSAEISPAQPHGDARDLLWTELRSIIGQAPRIFDDIGRTDAFIMWLEGPAAAASANNMDIIADFRVFTDLTPDEYAASAWVLTARCTGLANWDAVDQRGVAFDLTSWLAGVQDQRCLRAFVADNSVPMDVARQTWRDEPSLSYAAAKPLWTHPIVAASDELYCVPSPGLLINKFGDGFYFTLFDGYRSLSQPGEHLHLKFSRLWSEFFEDYVYGCLHDGYANRGDVLVFEEQEDDGELSTDVVIVENGDVMFIEVVAKRLNFERFVCAWTIRRFRKILRAAFAGRLSS